MATALYATSGSGPLAGSIAWMNLESLTLAPAATVHIINTLREGVTVEFNLNNRTLAGAGTTFRGRTPPLGANTPFGRTGYTNIGGNVIAYSGTMALGTSSLLTFSSIVVKDINGVTIPNYNVIMGYPEAMGLGEVNVLTTTGTDWSLLTVLPPVTGTSPPSSPTVAGVGTQSVTLTGANGLSFTAPILLTTTPSSVAFNARTPGTIGLEGIAVGVVVTGVTLKKVIENRISPSDQFTLSITGTPSSTATTSGTATGLQSAQANVIGPGGNSYTINETMAGGSSSVLGDYAQTIVASNLAADGTVFPTNPPLGNTFTLATGDYVVATITNSPIKPVVVSAKNVDKAFAALGDTLTYTVTVNVGATCANNAVFWDTIPAGTSFVSNSVTVNNSANTGNPTPPTGVSLGTLPIGITTINFKVKVTTIPTVNPIPNVASVRYQYTQSPTIPLIITDYTDTNTVTTQVNVATIPNPVKVVDKAFGKVGDTLLYTIVLANTGSTSATNVIFRDTIPTDTLFVPNSVTVGGATRLGAVVAPPGGLAVGTIPANGTLTVTFQVVVSTIPTPNPIPNSGIVSYTYTVDPLLGTTLANGTTTNSVNTRINTAIIDTTKSVSAANILIGDTVTYTIVLRNTGNTTANSVVMTDTIPIGSTFVADSVKVNGTAQLGVNPEINGVVVPTLPVGAVATVTFSVGFATIPSPNPASNTAVANYQYILDTSTPASQNASNSSNTVTTFVNPDANPLKVINKTSATVGETLVYFLQWSNVTNTTETNVIFVDTLPNGVSFVPNSVTVNGINQPGATITPPNGINTGTLPINESVSITYRVTIDTIPIPNPIPNTASATRTGVNGTQTEETNQVFTQVNFAELTRASKTVDRAFNTTGETMTYTLVLFNNGNTSANNVVITDTIPSGTNFVVNSVTVNGVSQPGAVVAPTTGLTLSCIPAGSAVTITFQVLIQSIPSPNPTPNTATATYSFVTNNATGQTQSGNINTNTVSTTIVDATIVSTKTTSKNFAQVGDTLTYTIVLVATGNTTANNAVLVDSLPSTLTYVPGTFAINGGLVAGANPAPPGQSIGSLTVPATYTITFSAIVNTIPSLNPIPNNATTSYTYTVDPTIANGRSRMSPSNIANTTISQANLGGITKSVDKFFADCGDTITYTLVIPNSGNATATNVVFKDTIPNGTVLVANSVMVNGTTQTGASPQTGVNLGTISPGATTTVVFKVVVQC